MEILIIWIATIIASFYMEMYNELRMFKDVADAGYKVDINRISELGKQLNPDATKITFMSLLVLGVNMLMVFQRAMQYNNVRPYVLDQLNVIDALEEMSELEKQEYAKKPTGFNALKIIIKNNIKESDAITIKINDDNGQSEIKFKINSSLDDIIILQVNGSVARLSEEEQKKKAIEALRTVFKSGVEKLEDKDAIIKALTSNTVIDLSRATESKKEEELPLETQQNEAQEFEITEGEIQSNTADKGPTLSKRIKY